MTSANRTSQEASGRILVVEDDEALSVGLYRNLRYDGYEVVVASTGGQAVEQARRFRPHVVILDIMLPDMSGFDVLTEIRTRRSGPEVIILSALGREEDKVRGLRLGADDYLAKPFGLAELLARVEAAMRRAKRTAGIRTRVRRGPLFLDLDARLAEKSGRRLQLTSREFDLLAVLIEADGRVLTREDLLHAVWGWDYEGTARTVDNFIRNLRKKIEDDPARPTFIRTVYGVGYRFGE